MKTLHSVCVLYVWREAAVVKTLHSVCVLYVWREAVCVERGCMCAGHVQWYSNSPLYLRSLYRVCMCTYVCCKKVLGRVEAVCIVGPVLCVYRGGGTLHRRLRVFVETHELVLKVLIARCVGLRWRAESLQLSLYT